MTDRIVLAYAGGPHASTAIPSLAKSYGAAVVTLTLDLGQERDLEEARDRALASGAVRAHVLDVREEFARDFVLPALRAGALHEGHDPMAAELAWPLIASKLLEIASIEHAAAIAHGCTGRDQQCIEASAQALSPGMRVIAAAGGPQSPHRIHANLWGRAYVTPSQIPNPKSQGEATPDTPAHVEVSFEQGVPAAINGVPMALAELIESLSIIAGQHGVGQIAVQESDVAGLRHVYEAPAAVVLHAAHAALEASVLPREAMRLKRDKAADYAQLVCTGRWFTPERAAIDDVNAKAQRRVNGSVRIRLFKGTLLTSETTELDHAAVPRT